MNIQGLTEDVHWNYVIHAWGSDRADVDLRAGTHLLQTYPSMRSDSNGDRGQKGVKIKFVDASQLKLYLSWHVTTHARPQALNFVYSN